MRLIPSHRRATHLSIMLCGVFASLVLAAPNGWCSASQAIMPVFEVEHVLDNVLPIAMLDDSPNSQLSALEILEQAYQLYLTDRMDGYSQLEAEQRLISILQAVGFESKSASTILKTLENSSYQVPTPLKQALRHISQL